MLRWSSSFFCAAAVSTSSRFCSVLGLEELLLLLGVPCDGGLLPRGLLLAGELLPDLLGNLRRVVHVLERDARDLDVAPCRAAPHLGLDLVLDALVLLLQLRVRVAREDPAARAAKLRRDDLVVVVRADLGIELVELGHDRGGR